MNTPAQNPARRGVLAALAALPALTASLPAQARSWARPAHARWQTAVQSYELTLDAEQLARAQRRDASEAHRFAHAEMERNSPPFPTEEMTVRDPARVKAYLAHYEAEFADRPGALDIAEVHLNNEHNIRLAYADAPYQRARLLALLDGWMAARKPHADRLRRREVDEAAATETHDLALDALREAAAALLALPSPSPSAIGYKLRVADDLEAAWCADLASHARAVARSELMRGDA